MIVIRRANKTLAEPKASFTKFKHNFEKKMESIRPETFHDDLPVFELPVDSSSELDARA